MIHSLMVTMIKEEPQAFLLNEATDNVSIWLCLPIMHVHECLSIVWLKKKCISKDFYLCWFKPYSNLE